MWSALLTGGQEAKGRGTFGDDVRDGAGRVPILWFQETDPHPTPRQPFHIDSQAPGSTVLADPDGNKACIGTFEPAH